jgi:hypothetical protein
VELVMLVKDLLYVDKYTIEGARARVDEYRRNGTLKSVARGALEDATVDSIEHDLQRIVAALDGLDESDVSADDDATGNGATGNDGASEPAE